MKSSSRLYDGWLYAMTIDRLLAGLRHVVATRIPAQSTVLDACCGTGALAIHLARGGRRVTGIDISPRQVAFARRAAEAAGLRADESIRFQVGDVARLEADPEDRYDLAVIVLALHEMEPATRQEAVKALARCARRAMFVDFSAPMPLNPQGIMKRVAESLAGIGHFRAFRDYSRRGGLPALLEDAGLVIEGREEIGSGTLCIITATRP